MKQKHSLLTLVGIFSASMLSAQVTFSEIQFFPTGVNNEGIVVGHKDQNTSQYLWDPVAQEMTEIGGISAGNNVGGVAQFSDDGKRIASTMPSNEIAVSSAWEKNVMNDYDLTFNGIYQPASEMYAIGSSTNGQTGAILRSMNKGKTWRVFATSSQENGGTPFTGGFEAMGWLNWAQGLVGGHNGAIYTVKSNGTCAVFDPHPEGNTKEVKTYWSIDFIPQAGGNAALYGAIGLEYKDGGYAVWVTNDSGDTFQEATGVAGCPVHISHFADAFYMVTRNGHIQTSTDNGLTWKDLYTEGMTLHRIKFIDEDNGMALGLKYVYVTTDGGKNWTKTEPGPIVDWNDLCYVDNTVTIVGSKGSVYETTDMGKNWKKIVVEEGDETGLYAAIASDTEINISGAHGTFYRQGKVNNVSGYAAGIYDVEADEWTPLESLGYLSGETASSAYSISGDGKVTVGNVYAYKKYNDASAIHSHAAAWNESGIIDLGSKFDDINRNTMAYKTSYDGSVVVGWQDMFGPWFASVWRKNETGGYDQSLMFKDPNKTEDDFDFSYVTDDVNGTHMPWKEELTDNLLGYCNAVSSDGKWIGGTGSGNWYATGSPWIWSKETGVIILDETESLDGTVSDMNHDATVVVGWAGGGTSPWIWTKEKGFENLNTYVTETLKYDLGEYYLCSVYDMSPNGRYIAGWCMKGMGKYGYVIDLKSGVGIESAALDQCKAAVYPNPVSTELHIDFPFDNIDTQVRLLDLQGRVVKEMRTSSINNVMNLSDVNSGFYILDVAAEGVHKTFKIEVAH